MTELDAKEAGALFYILPSELKPEHVDMLLRVTVQALNSTGWVWTAESCQGHPEEADIHAPWGHNAEPYLRLALRRVHLGTVVAILLREAIDENTKMIGSPQMKLRVRELRNLWVELQIYVGAHNVATRNRGCQALERFAFALQAAVSAPRLVQSEQPAVSNSEHDNG